MSGQDAAAAGTPGRIWQRPSVQRLAVPVASIAACGMLLALALALGEQGPGGQIALAGLAVLLPGLVPTGGTPGRGAAPCFAITCLAMAMLVAVGQPDGVVLAVALLGGLAGIAHLARPRLHDWVRSVGGGIARSEAWTADVRAVLLLLYCAVALIWLLVQAWTPMVVPWAALALAACYLIGLTLLATWGRMVRPGLEQG